MAGRNERDVAVNVVTDFLFITLVNSCRSSAWWRVSCKGQLLHCLVLLLKTGLLDYAIPEI